MRHVLRNVAAYRGLCAQVRRSSTGGLFFGALMLFLWYVAFGQRNDFSPFSIVYLGLAALEFSVAMWNRISPSAEGILFDGLVLMVFGLTTLVRYALSTQGVKAGPPPSVVFVLLSVYWLFSGFNTAMQALECGLPIAAFEGRFLRGRLASGVLRRMGLDELVATDDAGYVEIAVRLATDAAWWGEMRKRIEEGRAALYHDKAPVRGLEKFFAEALGR